MRAVVAVLLLLTLALAGCASKGGGDDDDGTSTATGTATATGSGSASKSGTTSGSSSATGTGSAANQPPVATIAATVNGTAVAFELKGTDPDGDALTWNLTFGDGAAADGTQLPANVTHDYAAGAFTANLTVSDGKASTVQNVTFNVTVAATPTTPQVASGEWVSGNMVTGCFGDIFAPVYPAQGEGVFYASFAVDAATIGQSFLATASSDGASDSPGFTFLDAAGEVLFSSFLDGSSLLGEVPDGAAKGVWWVCAGGPMSGTYETPAP